MDKFRRVLMVKKLRFQPNAVDINELLEYFTAQKFEEEAIDEVYIIINNSMSSIRPAIKCELNDIIIKSLKLVPRK